MKSLGYIALHYGKDYLGHCLKSIYNQVDEILILYVDHPSHGNGTSLICPDTKQELLDICIENDPDGKINWLDGDWRQEGQHRDKAFHYAKAKGFDIVVAIDFDEIWKPEVLKDLIKETFERKATKCLIWMRHLWKSFDFICDDAMRQERIYYLPEDKKTLIYASQKENQVFHFGYARKPEDIKYKISIHGHSAEWLTSKQQWFDDKYLAFPPAENVHPACENTWNPKPFDKNELPEIMKSHPYFNMQEIK